MSAPVSDHPKSATSRSAVRAGGRRLTYVWLHSTVGPRSTMESDPGALGATKNTCPRCR